MKTVTIEQVENGFIVKHDDRVQIATCVHSYSYQKESLTEMLKAIFEPKKTALVEVA